jgi:disulfide bond formation protein DsbB
MDVVTYSTFTSVMTLVAMGLAVAALVARFTMSDATRASLSDGGRWLAWLVAATCVIGSLLYSEVYLFEPCLFCWYQRIAMYPLAVVLLVASIRREPSIRLYGLPLSLIGLAFSIWHILVQNLSALQGSGACDPDNPCSAKYVNVFGFISIPVMAAAGFFLISVLLAFFSSTKPVSEMK